MFVALYEMKAKEGKEPEFEQAWEEWTDAIHRVRGSFGSRRHKTDVPRVYIAYAQWPSKEIHDKPGDEFTDQEKNASRRMREAAEDIKTLHLMHVFDGRLKPAK